MDGRPDSGMVDGADSGYLEDVVGLAPTPSGNGPLGRCALIGNRCCTALEPARGGHAVQTGLRTF